MKNYLKVFAVIIGITLAFSSCKDDESPMGSALIGTWEQVSVVISGCIDPGDNGTETCSASCDKLIITENTIKISNDPALPYTATSNTITTTETVGSTTEMETVNYTISGNTLIISFTDDIDNGGCSLVITFKKV